MKKRIGIVTMFIFISILSTLVAAEPEWCFGYTTTISCNGSGSNVDQLASMNTAVAACEASCQTQIQAAADSCELWCLNETLTQNSKFCMAQSSYNSFSCSVDNVSWVEPGVYSCSASGSTVFSCNCWYYEWDEIPRDL